MVLMLRNMSDHDSLGVQFPERQYKKLAEIFCMSIGLNPIHVDGTDMNNSVYHL